jgi:hypothetical protein
MKRLQKLLAAAVLVFAFALALLPAVAWAQAKPTPTPVPPASTPTIPAPSTAREGLIVCGNAGQKLCGVDDLFRGIVVLTNLLISGAGLVAVIVLVVAGFQMVIANGNPGSIKEAKGRIEGAVIGLFLVSAAFMLVNTLFAGSFSLGIRAGADAIIRPLKFINDAPATKSP